MALSTPIRGKWPVARKGLLPRPALGTSIGSNGNSVDDRRSETRQRAVLEKPQHIVWASPSIPFDCDVAVTSHETQNWCPPLRGHPVVHVREHVVDLVPEHLENDDHHDGDQEEDERVFHQRLRAFVSHGAATTTHTWIVKRPRNPLGDSLRDGHAASLGRCRD